MDSTHDSEYIMSHNLLKIPIYTVWRVLLLLPLFVWEEGVGGWGDKGQGLDIVVKEFYIMLTRVYVTVCFLEI